jgi:endonuclease G
MPIHVDSTFRARARLALQQAVRNYLFDPNVSLIDFGMPEHAGQIAEDEVAIRVHVCQKLDPASLEDAATAGETRPIPKYIGGFPTDVPEGKYQLQPTTSRRAASPLPQGAPLPSNLSASDPRSRRANPLLGGISISDERRYTYGTLGGLVKDRLSGDPMILSNWHVLVGEWAALSGQKIYQPGRRDGGNAGDTVATLVRDAMAVNLDAAVAKLTGSRSLVNQQINLGRVSGVGQAQLGMEVVKSGRRTGVTYGRVTAIEGVTRLRYGTLNRVIQGVMTVEQRQSDEQVSGPGDSGAWWLDTATYRAVGLHFAGSNHPERALALDMGQVLDALQVDIV